MLKKLKIQRKKGRENFFVTYVTGLPVSGKLFSGKTLPVICCTTIAVINTNVLPENSLPEKGFPEKGFRYLTLLSKKDALIFQKIFSLYFTLTVQKIRYILGRAV